MLRLLTLCSLRSLVLLRVVSLHCASYRCTLLVARRTKVLLFGCLYCSLCSLLIVYRYTHVRYAHYSLHYCLTLVHVRCTHILVLDTRAQAQSRVYVCDGPKGPGFIKKISRCSWIFMKLGDLKDPIFLIAFKKKGRFVIKISQGKTIYE
jgi:hypothetical protein